MSATNVKEMMPSILMQKFSKLTESLIFHALSAYCQAKSYNANMIKSKRITLVQLLPHLKQHSSKWTEVRLEHLRKLDHNTVKAMTSYLQKVTQDTELMRSALEEEEEENELESGSGEDSCNDEEEKKPAETGAADEGEHPKNVLAETQPAETVAEVGQMQTKNNITMLEKPNKEDARLDEQAANKMENTIEAI